MATLSYLTTTLFDFGAIARLGKGLQRLGIKRPLIATDRGVADAGILARVDEAIGGSGRGVRRDARQPDRTCGDGRGGALPGERRRRRDRARRRLADRPRQGDGADGQERQAAPPLCRRRARQGRGSGTAHCRTDHGRHRQRGLLGLHRHRRGRPQAHLHRRRVHPKTRHLRSRADARPAAAPHGSDRHGCSLPCDRGGAFAGDQPAGRCGRPRRACASGRARQPRPRRCRRKRPRGALADDDGGDRGGHGLRQGARRRTCDEPFRRTAAGAAAPPRHTQCRAPARRPPFQQERGAGEICAHCRGDGARGGRGCRRCHRDAQPADRPPLLPRRHGRDARSTFRNWSTTHSPTSPERPIPDRSRRRTIAGCSRKRLAEGLRSHWLRRTDARQNPQRLPLRGYWPRAGAQGLS